MLKSSFCTIGFQKNKWGKDRVVERPLTDILPILAAAGYDGVEIWESHIHGLGEDGVRAIRRQLDDLGLEVAMLSPYFDFSSSDETAEHSVAEGLQVLENARRLRSRAIRCFTGKTGSADATEEQWARTARSLQQLADASATDGIYWALETHPRNLMDSIDATLRLLREVDRPNVRLIFQPSTFAAEYQRAADVLGPYTIHVHATNTRDGQRAFIGEGDMDYADIMRRLRGHGVQGFVSVEWMGDDPEGTARREGPYLRTLLTE